MTVLVPCPCCHGARVLPIHDEDGQRLYDAECCHCIDGKVASEVSQFEDAEQVLKQFADWLTAKRKAQT